MRRNLVVVSLLTAFLSGCTTQSPQIKSTESTHSQQAQIKAQKTAIEQAVTSRTLKRKVDLGRITNETIYGKSLLPDSKGDVLGKQVTEFERKTVAKSGFLSSTKKKVAFAKVDLRLVDPKKIIMLNAVKISGPGR